MSKRIFIAINLPLEIKKQLLAYKDQWPELPARWVKVENLHLTLAFLGYVKDEKLPEVIEIVHKVASQHHPFTIHLTKIIYAPPDKVPPRMVWALGEKSEELTTLYNDLQRALQQYNFRTETRELTPHITLARIRTFAWRKMDLEERPQIDEEIDFSFEVNSIEVMESKLKREGAEYTVIEACDLGDI